MKPAKESETVQFRRIEEKGINKCRKCGHKIGVWWSWRTEYRTRLNSGRWSNWKHLQEHTLPKVEKHVSKTGPGFPE